MQAKKILFGIDRRKWDLKKVFCALSLFILFTTCKTLVIL